MRNTRLGITFKIFMLILLITLTPMFRLVAMAAEEPVLSVIETPLEGSETTQSISINGWAVSKTGIQKIDVYIDGNLHGQAVYGLERLDIAQKYPDHLDSIHSGFSYSLDTKKLLNGQHIIKIFALSIDGSKLEKQISVTTNNQQTPIMGQAIATKSQMMKYFLDVNTVKGFDYINNFVSITTEEAKIEGVRADVVFAQMMKETNFLRFGGDVKEEQNNFAGLGATGGGNPGLSFPDIRTGIRAVIQHLKGYATTDPLVQVCVDPRYQYVRKGSSPIVEWLGKNENPTGYGWATDPNYGYDIVNRVNYIKNLKISLIPASASALNIDENLFVRKSALISGSGTGDNKVFYQFWIKDYSTGKWALLQDYSEKNTYTWIPSKSGSYRIEMHVKDMFSNKEYDDLIFKDINVKDIPPAKVSSISIPSYLEVNNSYNLAVSGTSTFNVLYQFWLKDYSTGTWKLLRDYSENNTYSWMPEKVGNYRIEMHIKDQYSIREFDDIIFRDVTVNTAPPADLTSMSVESKMQMGVAYEIATSGVSKNKILYQYWLKDYSADKWILLKDYTDSNTYSWTPSKAGYFRLEVHAKDSFNNNEFDDFIFRDIEVYNPNYAAGAKIQYTGIFEAGLETALSGSGISNSKIFYQFWAKDYENGRWTLLQDYSENSSIKWKPSKSGNYRIELHIKNYQSGKEFDDLAFKDITVSKAAPAVVTSFTVGSDFQAGVYSEITGTATNNNKVLYQFWTRDYATGKWTLAQDYSENSIFKWMPTKSGTYRIEMHAKGIYSESEYDAIAFSDVSVKQAATAVVTSFTVGSDFEAGVYSEITGTATNNNKVLYQFWTKDYATGKWALAQDYSENSIFKWMPTKSGTYRIEMHAKSIYSEREYDSIAFSDVSVKQASPAVINSFSVATEMERGKTYGIVGNAVAKTETLYQFWARDYSKGVWTLLRDYSIDNVFNWTPMIAGNFRIEMHVKSKFSEKEFDNIIFQDIWVKTSDLSGITIMLDAGHGGDDPGAINKTLNLYEKNLNMSLTQRIASKLLALSANIIYTRQPDNDINISLQDRSNMANTANPDLLLSIHHDSLTDGNASGVSTHYSSYRPAVENTDAYVVVGGKRYPVLYEDSNKNIYYNDNGVTKSVSLYNATVYDPTPCDAAQQSADLANIIQGALVGLGFKDRGAQDHNLYITRWPVVPVVLIEAGFISNQNEALKISNAEFEDLMATKIVESILIFFTNGR